MNSGSYLSQGHDERLSPELQRNSQRTSLNSASIVFVPTTQTDYPNYSLRNEISHCLWQAQYYSETLEPSSSNVSLFAQTKQEEDEIFYATFPQARGRHWTSQAIPYSGYFGDTAFYLGNDPSSGYTSSCPPSVICNPEAIYTQPPALTPSVSSELMAAISLCSGESAAQIDSNLFQSNLASSERGNSPHEPALSLKVEPRDLPFPKTSPQALKVDVESANQAKIFHGTHEPLMDFLSPPCAEAEASSQVPLLSNDIKRTTNGHLGSSPTGTWPSMQIRSLPSPSDSVKSESPTAFERSGASASPAPTIIPLAAPSPQEQEQSTRTGKSTPTGLMRLSPLLVNRRPVEKKKTVAIACNFCRKRKIACGPPLAAADGTVEKTCNQCQRRSRECVFPTESRRGLRKKKT